jgi:hypothetical protein
MSEKSPSRDTNRLPRALRITAQNLDLLLALSIDQFQRPKFLFSEIRQRYRDPHPLRIEKPEAPAHQDAVRRIHRLFEQVRRTAIP